MTINLLPAKASDLSKVIGLDPLRRGDIIKGAIEKGECFLIMAEETPAGFAIFNNNFFGRGFIDLIEIDDKHKGIDIGCAAVNKLCGMQN